MSTVADLTEVELPPDAAEDSDSFLATLLGDELEDSIRNPLLHESGLGEFAIRDGDWKLILAEQGTTPGMAGLLYNLAEDLGEQNNLYDLRPDVVHRLTGILDQYQRQGASARRLVGVPTPGALAGGVTLLLGLWTVRLGLSAAHRGDTLNRRP